MLLSDFLRARPGPMAPHSAFAAACAQVLQPPEKAESAGPWLTANGELADGIMPRGDVLVMPGLQEEPKELQAESSAPPAALFFMGLDSVGFGCQQQCGGERHDAVNFVARNAGAAGAAKCKYMSANNQALFYARQLHMLTACEIL